jgi:hypothetical protein
LEGKAVEAFQDISDLLLIRFLLIITLSLRIQHPEATSSMVHAIVAEVEVNPAERIAAVHVLAFRSFGGCKLLGSVGYDTGDFPWRVNFFRHARESDRT